MRLALNDRDLSLAFAMAQARQTSNHSNGVRDAKQSPRAPLDLHFDGCVGEVAFAKRFNLYPDTTASPRKGGFDFMLQGLRVDVKARRQRPNGPTDLLIHFGKGDKVDADIFAHLVIADDYSVDFVGRIRAEDALQARYVSDLGRGVGYVIPCADLTPFRE